MGTGSLSRTPHIACSPFCKVTPGSDLPTLASWAWHRSLLSIPYLHLLQGGPRGQPDRGVPQDPGDRLGQLGLVALSRPKEKRRYCSDVAQSWERPAPRSSPREGPEGRKSAVLGVIPSTVLMGFSRSLSAAWHHPPLSIMAIHPHPSWKGLLLHGETEAWFVSSRARIQTWPTRSLSLCVVSSKAGDKEG